MKKKKDYTKLMEELANSFDLDAMLKKILQRIATTYQNLKICR